MHTVVNRPVLYPNAHAFSAWPLATGAHDAVEAKVPALVDAKRRTGTGG